MNDVLFSSTAEAREKCKKLDGVVVYYNNLIGELKNAREKLVANWEGDAIAISDTMINIDELIDKLESKLVKSISNLSSAIVELSEQVDNLSTNDFNK